MYKFKFIAVIKIIFKLLIIFTNYQKKFLFFINIVSNFK